MNAVIHPGAWVRVSRYRTTCASDADWPPTRTPEEYHGRIERSADVRTELVYLVDEHGQGRVVFRGEIFPATVPAPEPCPVAPGRAPKAGPGQQAATAVPRPVRAKRAYHVERAALADVPGLSLGEVALRAGVGVALVSKAAQRGELVAVKHSHKCVRVTEEECDRWIAGRKAGSGRTWLTVTEAAERCGCFSQSIQYAVKSGRLVALSAEPRRCRFDPVEVDRWNAARPKTGVGRPRLQEDAR